MAQTTPSTPRPQLGRRGSPSPTEPVVAAPSREPGSAEPAAERWPVALLGFGLLGCGLFLLVLGRHLWFFQDEYFWILHRGPWSANAFLENTNGHLMLVPLVVYKLLFATVGLHHAWPYRLVLVCLHLTCVLLLYVIAARRIGRVAALVPAGLLLALGSAAPDLLFAIQMGLVGSLAAWLGALLCLDREDAVGDRLAAGLLCVSIACQGIGIPLVLAVLVELVVTRRTRPRLWIAIVPLALYALWYVGYGTSEVVGGNVRKVPRYDVDIASYGFAGIIGVPIGLGYAMLVAAAIWLGQHLLKGRGLSPRTITCLLAVIGFWTIVALTRAQYQEPQAPRFIYPSALLILLGFTTIMKRPRTIAVAAVAFAGLVAFAALSNYPTLLGYERDRTGVDTEVRAELGAAEIAAPVTGASFVPDPHRLPWLHESEYLHAVHELGSPALTSEQILAQSRSVREAADLVLVRAENVPVDRTPEVGALVRSKPAPILRSNGVLIGATRTPRSDCTSVTPRVSGASATTEVGPGHGLYVSLRSSGSIVIYVHRLAARTKRSVQTLQAASTPTVLSFVRDTSALPWHVRLVPRAPTVLCVI